MKRFVLFIFALAAFAGVSFGLYTIFNSKNIDSVELIGDIQTIYFLDTDENFDAKPNFQDAKLKITYKNNEEKFISLNDASVDVANFFICDVGEKSMRLTYKSNIVKIKTDDEKDEYSHFIKYYVINSGVFYESAFESYDVTLGSNSENKTYKITETPTFYSIEGDGILNYYFLSGGKWCLHDGHYDNTYKYELKGDSLNIYLGEETPKYQIKASIVDEKVCLKSTLLHYDETQKDLVIRKDTTTFGRYLIDTSAVVESSDILTDGKTAESLVFKVNDTLEKNDNKLSIKVTFSKSLIALVDGLKEIYVVPVNNMVVNNTLKTDKASNFKTEFYVNYSAFEEAKTLYYTVAEAQEE